MPVSAPLVPSRQPVNAAGSGDTVAVTDTTAAYEDGLKSCDTASTEFLSDTERLGSAGEDESEAPLASSVLGDPVDDRSRPSPSSPRILSGMEGVPTGRVEDACIPPVCSFLRHIGHCREPDLLGSGLGGPGCGWVLQRLGAGVCHVGEGRRAATR